MILFLDFDGVLHPFLARASSEAFCYLPRVEKVLREFPAVRIVIASTQREHTPLALLVQRFSPDIAARIIGTTPVLAIRDTGDVAGSRYREIQAYLSAGGSGPWLALDDDASLFPPGCAELILCDDGFCETEERALCAAFADLYPLQKMTLEDQPPDILSGRRSAFSSGITLEELPHFEMRALAMIGAGLLKKHRGDPKAIKKLSSLAVAIDGTAYNLTLKTLAALCEEVAGSPLYDEAADFLEIQQILVQRGKA